MPLNRNTLMRIKIIDDCLHRRYRPWTIEDLREACEEKLSEYEGVDGVSLRTVQRDIELMRGDKLGYFAPIVVKNRKYYEYEDPDFSITRLPLSKQDIEELSSAMDIIAHYSGFQTMTGQEDVLTRLQDYIRYQANHSQIVFIETNKKLKGLNFLSCLYDYIKRECPLTIEYKSFKSARPSKRFVSPYILKEFNNRWFLLAYEKKNKYINTIALDRIVKIEEDKGGEFIRNTFFNPQDYFEDMVGVTRELESKKERVILKVDSDQAPYILTKPIHGSQTLVDKDDTGGITIALNMIQNLELERVILGYGDHIEVLSPRLLRHRIARSILVSASKYTDRPSAL